MTARLCCPLAWSLHLLRCFVSLICFFERDPFILCLSQLSRKIHSPVLLHRFSICRRFRFILLFWFEGWTGGAWELTNKILLSLSINKETPKFRRSNRSSSFPCSQEKHSPLRDQPVNAVQERQNSMRSCKVVVLKLSRMVQDELVGSSLFIPNNCTIIIP